MGCDVNHVIAVIGPGDEATSRDIEEAEAVGRLLAQSGHAVVNGGLSGVMDASARGASSVRGAVVIGLLPGLDRTDANPHLTFALPTGLGELRNGLIIRGSEAVICVGGSWGTLSEVALAVRTGVPLVVLHGWHLPTGPVLAETPSEAVASAVRLAGRTAAMKRPSE